jgi:hypothetical protein
MLHGQLSSLSSKPHSELSGMHTCISKYIRELNMGEQNACRVAVFLGGILRAVLQHTMEPPLNVPQCNDFHHLMFNFNNSKSIISALNYLHLRFSSVQCSNPLISNKTLNEGFTILK